MDTTSESFMHSLTHSVTLVCFFSKICVVMSAFGYVGMENKTPISENIAEYRITNKSDMH